MIVAKFDPSAERIILSGPLTFRNWYASMPEAKWTGRAWSIAATAEAAIRIGKEAQVGVSFDRHLLDLIGEHLAANKPKDCTVYDQPAIRKADGWRHQCGAYQFAFDRPATMFYMGMGTGKSKPTAELIVNWRAAATLMLCPPSVMAVWRRELRTWTDLGEAVLILDGPQTSPKKVELAEAHLKRFPQAVVVVSFQTAIQSVFANWLKSRRWTIAALDESHRAKAATGVTGRMIMSLTPRSERRLCLTGTPMPHSPGDIFSQYRFLDPTLFGLSWTNFKAIYATIGGFNGRQIVGWKNVPGITERFYKLAYRVGREVLDLPEVMHIERPIKLGREAVRIYEDLEEDLIADVNTAEIDGVVSAANALVKGIRLSQVTSGFVPVEDMLDPEVKYITRIDSAKQDALEEFLEDVGADEPIVVFCIFKADLAAIRETAAKLGRRYGEVSGQENCLTEDGKMPDDVDVVGVQEQSGGVGIDLTRSAYGVLYSVSFSLGNYDQFLCRMHRPGQKRAVRFVHLIAEETIDRRKYTALSERRDVIDSVLQSYQFQR